LLKVAALDEMEPSDVVIDEEVDAYEKADEGMLLDDMLTASGVNGSQKLGGMQKMGTIIIITLMQKKHDPNS